MIELILIRIVLMRVIFCARYELSPPFSEANSEFTKQHI